MTWQQGPRHDGRVRCLAVVWRLPIGLKGASEARLRLSGGKPGDAATWSTGAGHDLAARHDGPSQMRVRFLAVCGDWLEGGQRPAKSDCVCRDTGGKPGDAATSTHAHGHLLMTIDIDGPSVQGAAGSEAELQLCVRALFAIHNNQHAFDAVWLLLEPGRICNLLAP